MTPEKDGKAHKASLVSSKAFTQHQNQQSAIMCEEAVSVGQCQKVRTFTVHLVPRAFLAPRSSCTSDRCPSGICRPPQHGAKISRLLKPLTITPRSRIPPQENFRHMCLNHLEDRIRPGAGELVAILVELIGCSVCMGWSHLFDPVWSF